MKDFWSHLDANKRQLCLDGLAIGLARADEGNEAVFEEAANVILDCVLDQAPKGLVLPEQIAKLPLGERYILEQETSGVAQDRRTRVAHKM